MSETRGLYGGENVVLVTGLPGRGKTLLALWLVDRISAGRPVYVAGVRGLKPRDGWEVLEDRTKWHECPAGSVVLIDEGQECFRPAGTGAAVPEHIARMERVRHAGITLVITTQHPMLIHPNVRKLTQVHLHLVRKFGGESADVYRWDMCADVGTRSALLSAVKSASRTVVWPYPKEVYGWYESAEVHTVQKKLPWQRVFVFAVPLIVVGLLVVGYQALHRVQQAPSAVAGQGAGGAVSPAQAPPAVAGGGASRSNGGMKTTAQWISEQAPRIAGLPHTAPVYDRVTEPVRAPYPAACVASASRCVCYTSQATRLPVEPGLCRLMAETGYFVAWDTGEGAPRSGAGTASSAAPGRQVEAGDSGSG